MTFGPFRQFVVESSLISYTTATTTGSVYRLLVVKKERSIIMTVCVVKDGQTTTFRSTWLPY